MGGYWETGSILIDRRPISMTIMAITQAKIGRFMKKRGMEKLLMLSARIGRIGQIGQIGQIRQIGRIIFLQRVLPQELLRV